MSFSHLTGLTTPGAPDELIDWFATFEAWITGQAGWIVVSGAGSTNLFIRSLGEEGGLTMLYAHVWRGVGANIDRVYVEVCDDAVPTHTTSRDGYVDSGGAQFEFWMTGDKAAFVLVFREGANYRMVYGGLLRPFAMNLNDETYCLVATNGLSTATILRRHDGLWDQDANIWGNTVTQNARIDRNDGSFPLGSCYFDRLDDIAGQFRHISWVITDPAVNVLDTIPTGPGDDTEWIILRDQVGSKFALRTGGVLPVGVDYTGSHFAHRSGLTELDNFFDNILPTFLGGIGWTVTDFPGSPHYRDKRCHSSGEDGTEDIWVRIYYTGTYYLSMTVMSDGVATQETISWGLMLRPDYQFPVQYWISADRDWVLFTMNWNGSYPVYYAGLVIPSAPGLPSSPYRVVSQGQAPLHVLRGHDGAWDELCVLGWDAAITGSNPNLYDGTYLIWPYSIYETVGAGREVIGEPKYMGRTSGGISVLDRIDVRDQQYIVFRSGTFFWTMRIA